MHYLGFGNYKYGEIGINHNSDWSGNAIIDYRDENGNPVKVEIPGELLLVIGREAALKDFVGRTVEFLESMEDGS